MLTAQMKKDLKKLRDEDALLCNKCGSDDIDEKLWVKVNEYVLQNGKVYHEVTDNADDMFWCQGCGCECSPVSIDEYNGRELK